MFGSCAGKAAIDSEADDNPRRPKRYEGQHRELIVKVAWQVAHHTLVADISEIEEKLSDDEREYEAKAAIRQQEQRRREEELKEAAIQQVVSGASAMLPGGLLDRMQGLAKLRESAKSAVKLELGNLARSGKSGSKSAPSNGGSITSAADELKMPVPEASAVLVKVTHPCYVSVLRAKLHRSLDIPLADVRVVHRYKTLKDEDLVPADSVDYGEQEEVEEVLNGEGLDLSYLWVVDANSLGPQPRSSTDTQEKHTISITTSDDEQGNRRRSSRGEKSSEGDPDGVAKKRDESADVSAIDSNEARPDVAASPPDGALDEPVNGKAKKRSHTTQESTGGGGGVGGVGDSQQLGQKQGKKSKGRLVPGSLLLTSLSASALPNTEKGAFSKQDPYMVVKWGGQEVRTSAKRDSGKECSWPKEELVLIVRTKKQLQEPVEVEVWNDNAGDKKPSPDVVIGKGSLPVKHLAVAPPAAAASTIDGNDGGEGGDRDDNTDDERGSDGVVLNVALVPGTGRKKKITTAGVVTLTLAYIPPRRKPPKAARGGADWAASIVKGGDGKNDQTGTDTDDDTLTSIAGLSALSSQGKRNHLSVQELGAAISQALEGFDVREELNNIGCLRFAQGIINEGFGQRGAFASIQEEHLAGPPMFVPRGARKRVLALAELIRLQMKAETDKATTAIEVMTKSGEGPFDGSYTVDGVEFFSTLAAMKSSLEEDKAKAEMALATKEEDLPPRPKPPKPRSAAKEKIIRAIEATAEEEERGIYRTATATPSGGESHGVRKLDGEEKKPCCEKHAFQLERSAVHMLEERIKDTLSKVDTQLNQADRFKNGAIHRDDVGKVIRDAHILNGLPSPRESDARNCLQHASIDNQGLHFDRSKLGVEVERLIRKELTKYAP